MGRFTAQPVLGALRFLSLHELPASPQDVLAAWESDRRPTTQLRVTMEGKSDFTFVQEMVSECARLLEEEGLDAKLAEAAIAAVLATPSLAMSATQEKVTNVAHAVIIRRDEDAGFPYEVLITVRASVMQRHVPEGETVVVPPHVTSFSIAVALIDMDDTMQVGELMAHYIDLLRDVGPQRARKTFPHTVLFLGDLTDLGTRDAPSHWKEDIVLLAEAFDAKVIFERGPKISAGVPRALMKLFVLDPYVGKLPEDEDQNEIPHVSVDARNLAYVDVFQTLSAELAAFRPRAAEDPFTPRALKPGEKVFHRKVGDSRGGFDNFNAGSPDPCSHDKGFKRYFKSDQATKGFERRYTNFEASWLYHCDQGGCGVYAVFCPDRAA